ncbi:MAG: sulfurtransferase TusA family protein [Nitrospinae bacterium]|nr:sulfurtransferase TusA family protein [Nitrospinota bacterium]
MEIKSDKFLDCKGLNCPLPILKTKKAIEDLQIGQILEMHATDPGSKNDMAAWSKRTGNEIIKTNENNGVFIFFVRKTSL